MTPPNSFHRHCKRRRLRRILQACFSEARMVETVSSAVSATLGIGREMSEAKRQQKMREIRWTNLRRSSIISLSDEIAVVNKLSPERPLLCYRSCIICPVLYAELR